MIEYSTLCPEISGPVKNLPIWSRTIDAKEFIYCCETPNLLPGARIAIWSKDGSGSCRRILYDTGKHDFPLPKRLLDRRAAGLIVGDEEAKRDCLLHKGEYDADLRRQLDAMRPRVDEAVGISSEDWAAVISLLNCSGLLHEYVDGDMEGEEHQILSDGPCYRIVVCLEGRTHDIAPYDVVEWEFRSTGGNRSCGPVLEQLLCERPLHADETPSLERWGKSLLRRILAVFCRKE